MQEIVDFYKNLKKVSRRWGFRTVISVYIFAMPAIPVFYFG